MTDCTRCIMEHSDGIILLKPTIYIIEGDFHAGKTEDGRAGEDLRTGHLRTGRGDDECPF